MKTLKVVLPAAILAAGFLVCTTSSYGKPEYAKKESKPCGYCHAVKGIPTKDTAKDFTDAGKCYAKNDHSLAKCAAPAEKK